MSTIKQDRKDLQMLLDGIDPIVSTPSASPVLSQANGKQDSSTKKSNTQQSNIVDNTAGTNFTAEPVFDFDYDSIRKGLRKKCRKTVLSMVKHILPPELAEEEYILDKMEQDTDTLTDLYMQLETNKVMQKALLMAVQGGNMMPRMFEVFGQLTDKIQAINKQIVDTEQKIRKTYLDLKFETIDKQAELSEASNQKMITGGPMQTDNGVIFTSTKDLIAAAKKKHQEALANAQEAELVEEAI